MEVLKTYPENIDKRTQYKLMKSPDVKRMIDADGAELNVKSWLVYTDEDHTVLALETEDGEMFATISKVFQEEFKEITEVFGDDVGVITVMARKSKAGRNYITCMVI